VSPDERRPTMRRSQRRNRDGVNEDDLKEMAQGSRLHGRPYEESWIGRPAGVRRT